MLTLANHSENKRTKQRYLRVSLIVTCNLRHASQLELKPRRFCMVLKFMQIYLTGSGTYIELTKFPVGSHHLAKFFIRK